MADIRVMNPKLGLVELNLVQFKRGEWCYHIVRIDGKPVWDELSDPVSKVQAVLFAKEFGKTCEYTPGLGYHL